MSKINFTVPLLLCAISVSAQSVYAEDINGSALEQAQNCLTNQNCAAALTADGLAADQKALDAVGGNQAGKQELYTISAEILPFLITQSAGDPGKMAAIMEKAQSNPEAFFNSLPAEIQTKIKNAARR